MRQCFVLAVPTGQRAMWFWQCIFFQASVLAHRSKSGALPQCPSLRFLSLCVWRCVPVVCVCGVSQVVKSTGLVPRNAGAKAARMLTAPVITTVRATRVACGFHR